MPLFQMDLNLNLSPFLLFPYLYSLHYHYLKKMDVIIKYLIYQQLKELNNNLSLIDEALSIKELEK